MVKSYDKTDQRFIDMVRLQHAQKYGVKIGFKGFNQKEHEARKLSENQSE